MPRIQPPLKKRIGLFLLVYLVVTIAAATFCDRPNQHTARNFLIIGQGYLLILAGGVSLTRWYFNISLREVLQYMRSKRCGNAEPPAQTLPNRHLREIVCEFDRLYEALGQTRTDFECAQARQETHHWRQSQEFRRDLACLAKKAKTDAMTGLANRASLDQQLLSMFDDACRQGHDLACLMIDLDHFKAVNDSLGHQRGDELLNFLSDLLRACTRRGDCVARYGGDEFILLLPHAPQCQARAVAERIRLLFEREAPAFVSPPCEPGRPFTVEKTNIAPQLSIGLATLKNHAPTTPQDLLQMADESLYQAKRAGRNRVHAG